MNGKCYVGSTRYIKNRITNYFNLAQLAAQKSRSIPSATLKDGLVNFVFIVIEVVDIDLNNTKKRETYWIKHIKPEYIAIKDAARNVGSSHSSETKLALSYKAFKGAIYIYNEFKKLLVIAPSLISVAILLGNKSISISLNRAIKEIALFRYLWYLSRFPFRVSEVEKALMKVPWSDYTNLIAQMKSKKHIRKSIFVFKGGEFLSKYDRIMIAAKTLNTSHDTIKINVVKNTTYKGYKFSYHRI